MLKNLFAPVTVALAALFMQQAWWIRGLTGAIVGAALFIAIPAAIEWAKQRADTVTLRVDCFPDFLPTKLPTDGRVLVAQLLWFPETPHQVGQQMLRYGEPNATTGFPPTVHAYKCEVRTVGRQHPIFDVAFFLSVKYKEVIRHKERAGAAGAGAIVRSGILPVQASKVEDAAPFTFWITNDTSYFAEIADFSAQAKNNDPRLTINHNISPHGLGFSPRDL